MLELPDMIRFSGAPDMLLLAHVVLVCPVAGVATVGPALGKSIVVTGHIALDVLALPVRYVCFPIPIA